MNERELYRQDAFPVFQNRVYGSSQEALDCGKGDIILVESLVTGLVHNRAFRPDLVDYDVHYQNEQGHSPLFRVHLDEVADLLIATMGRERIVEVGCGKGTFLELLLARGVDVTGFDPVYEGDNPRIAKTYFDEKAGLTGDGLILRHVLEHIPDPLAFLKSLSAANGRRGLVYLEVPCFDWICRNHAWFDIFYEHVNYFRLSDFHRMFGRVLHARHTFGGQYLSVVADLASLRDPAYDPADRVRFPADFVSRSDAEAAEERGRVVVWGGASKGVIFALLRKRSGQPVDRVIDINPAKQGKFLAGTGLRVMSPAEGLAGLPKGTRIYVMNPNYLDEIRRMAGPDFICKSATDD